jgi:FtsZ-interacting cell division protein YlmF
MVSARDAYDDWYEDDEPYAAPQARWYEEEAPRPLAIVRPPALAFELIAPEDFDDAQRIADRLRAGVPVLIDFHGCDRSLAGRLTDFASGLVYALEGSLQHVGRDVLLLTPDRVDISGDDASAVREPGFYNRI